MVCAFDRASTVKEGRLREVVLSGQARVERTTGDFSGNTPPDLLSIRSQTITMSPSGNTVNAEGPGQVVFRSADQSQEGPFRGAGESLLEFQEELRLRPAPRERLVIELAGEVGCIHQDSARSEYIDRRDAAGHRFGTSEGRDLSGIAAEGGGGAHQPAKWWRDNSMPILTADSPKPPPPAPRESPSPKERTEEVGPPTLFFGIWKRIGFGFEGLGSKR